MSSFNSQTIQKDKFYNSSLTNEETEKDRLKLVQSYLVKTLIRNKAKT